MPRTPQDAKDVLNGTMTEEALLQAVTEALTRLRWRWQHIRRSDLAQLQGDPGLADIIAVRGDRLLFIECKSAKGRLRPGQVEWSAALMEVGYHHGQPETWTLRPGSLDMFLESVK